MKVLFDDGKPLVCFFDSGIGGLTLLCEAIKRSEGVHYAYFADNYNVPYGRYSHDELLGVADGIFGSISGYNPSAAVIACNTVTAHCAAYLRDKYNFPIIGIQPAIKPAVAGVKSCLVLATPATANSRSLSDLVARFGNGITEVVACPKLASYIEENAPNFSEEKIFNMLPDIKTQSVVLGCTHYIYVKQIISKFYGGCPVFDGVEGTVNRLLSILGICDHFSEKSKAILPAKTEISVSAWEEVVFIGGNVQKNAKILKFLLK